MTPLETRYRRLLGVYPPGHREAYEKEMLGVLMSGSRPGQRFPGLAEAADLIRAGLRARLSSARHALRSPEWRDAARVVALLTALLMLAGAGESEPISVRLDLLGSPDGQVLAMVLRAVAWFAVVVAILAGRRRVAAALGLVALMAEVGGAIAYPPDHALTALRFAWSPFLIALCVGSLFMAIGGRTAGAVSGRRGVVLMAAGVVVAVATDAVVLPPQFYGWFFGASWYGLPQPLLTVEVVLLLAGAWRAGRRVLVLLASALVVPLGHAVLWNAPDLPIGVGVIVLLGVVVVLPIVTLAVGVVLMRWREAVSSGGTEVM